MVAAVFGDIGSDDIIGAFDRFVSDMSRGSSRGSCVFDTGSGRVVDVLVVNGVLAGGAAVAVGEGNGLKLDGVGGAYAGGIKGAFVGKPDDDGGAA
jgi:hypothetical protein